MNANDSDTQENCVYALLGEWNRNDLQFISNLLLSGIGYRLVFAIRH